MKTCRKCKAEKQLSDFAKNKRKKDGLDIYCRICNSQKGSDFNKRNPVYQKEYKAKWYAENKDRELQNKVEYRTKNKEKLKQKSIEWYQKNKEHSKQMNAEWRTKNREQHRKNIARWQNKRRTTNLSFRLAHGVRTRLNHALKKGWKAGSAVKDLGCSIDELKTYLESKFLPGMTWDNWAKDGWHIDHIIPLSSFDLTDREQLLKACHYTNLQPLWWKDNISKSDKLI